MNKLLIGSIIRMDDTDYRIISIQNGNYILCEMNITKLRLSYFHYNELQRKLRNNEAEIIVEENLYVIDFNTMKDKEQKRFFQAKEIVTRISDTYGPTYIGLIGKQKKPVIEELISEYKILRSTLWIYIRKYLQSGFQDISLVDRRYINSPGENKTQYHYKTKTGRPKDNGIVSGIPLNDTVKKQFEEYLNEYKRGREQSYKKAYCGLIDKYYSKHLDNGYVEWLPISERPTYRQFYYYCSKNISQEEKDIIKTSKQEQRNSKRLLLSSSRIDAIRPGWIVESDALEADFSIVSQQNSEQSVGRPIVYVMIDVYSSVIVAISVSFENNSVLGLTNLFLNLGDNKEDFAAKYGITFDEQLWPSNFIPHEIRCDRGPDFKSDKFSKICQRLGITRTLEPGATGSMKGIVEQSFHQFQATLRPEMEKKGLITYRYNSKHHREAMITLHTFTQMLINYVLSHNQKYIKDYPMEKNMYKTTHFKPVPYIIWNYGCEKYGNPKMITNASRMQYIYNLMSERTASLSRKGIKLDNLFYINSDEKLLDKMYALGSKHEKFTIRCDPRDVGTIYYMHDNKLYTASLNTGIPGNKDFDGMTWKEYEEFYKRRKMLRAEGIEHNMQVDANLYKVYRHLTDSRTTNHFADDKNLREARKSEKQVTNYNNRVSTHIAEFNTVQNKISTIELDVKEVSIATILEEDDPFTPNLDLRKANIDFDNRRRSNL